LEKCAKFPRGLERTNKKADDLWSSAFEDLICIRWCPEEDSNLHASQR
jgi:hypothetical protein